MLYGMKKIIATVLVALSLGASCQDKEKPKQGDGKVVLAVSLVNETIAVDEFQKKMSELKDAQLLDVRTPGEYEDGHLKGALNINWKGNDFEQQASKLDKTKPVLVYCLGGGRSAAAAEKMQAMGFTAIYNMEGGFMKWTSANKPVDYPASALDKPQGMSVADYTKKISAEKKEYVLVDFTAKWCGPCKKMMPMLEKIAGEKKDKLSLMKVDADENKGLLKEKGINSIPYFELYRNGKLVWKHGGYMDEETFLKETKL